MAKQNVGFVERHLEKIVFGVAGAVLVGTAFLYIVQNPYFVTADNEVLSPAAFYTQLEDEVVETLKRMKDAQPPELPPWKPPQLAPKKPNELVMPVMIGSLNPPVPTPDKRIELGKELELVAIRPPGKPATTVGRGTASPVPPVTKVFGVGEPPPAASTSERPAATDVHWIAVFATIPRQGQQNDFMEAKYAVNCQQLVVTKVEAQRQRMLPNGDWQETAEDVVPFASHSFVCPPTVPLATENGEPTIAITDQDMIRTIGQELRQNQPALLRPDFQNQLEANQRLDWKVPDELPGGVKFDWLEDYKVTIPAKAAIGTEAVPADRAATARTTPSKAIAELNEIVAKGMLAEAAKDYTEAKAHYDEASAKLKQVIGNSALTPKNKTDLEDLEKNLQSRRIKLDQEQSKARLVRVAAQEATLGSDVDLCWLTDPTALPGEVYRYRLRLVAWNPHAGLLRKLKNPEDAAKVVLDGTWSQWSDPVSLPVSQQLLFTGVDPAADGFKVELYQWIHGEMKIGRQTLSLGQPASWTATMQEYRHDAIIVALDSERQYEERSIDAKRKAIRYSSPRPTSAVVYVSANGDVEEHLQLKDTGRRRKLDVEMAAKPTAATPTRGTMDPTRRARDRRAD